MSAVIVTDSATMLPDGLIAQRPIRVVPLSIMIEGHEYLDGIEITSDALYQHLDRGGTVTTSQPSPGRIGESYRAAASAGADEIISIHIGSSVSGTVQSARLAAASAPVPVTVVDTGQASFAAGLCVLEAVERLAAGRPAAEAADAARRAGERVGSTFVVKALDLIRRSGRMADATPADVPVLTLERDGVKVAGTAGTVADAVELMAAHVRGAAAVAARADQRLRVGIGHGAAAEIAGELRRRVDEIPEIEEVIEYVVGPSIGAHLGPGNAGAVFVARPIA